MVNKESRLNVSMVKDQSRKMIFQHILNSSKTTRLEIARNTNLSLGTVKTVIEEFLREGILVEEKDTSRTVGRKPFFIRLLPESKYICVLTLAKDHFHCDILNLQLESKFNYIYHYKAEQSFKESFDEFLKNVKEKISFIQEGHLLGFGISVPGPYHPETDQVVCDLIPALNNIHLKELMESTFDAPVFIGNDVRLAAFATSQQIIGLGDAPLFYVYLSEGVGGACIQDDRVFLGANQFAGEIGQISLNDGVHLEDIIGWSALLGRLGLDPESDESEIEEELLSRWQQNEARLNDEVDKLVDLLSQVLSFVVCIINPKIIVIGGKYQFLGESFLSLLKEKLFNRLIDEHKRQLDVTFSREEAVLDPVIGAAMSIANQWLETGFGRNN